MRMWMCNPKILCNKHLFGEHVETHMFLGSLKKKIKINGYIQNNLFEPLSLIKRHNDLVNEILFRKFKHSSKLNVFEFIIYSSYLEKKVLKFKINKTLALSDLLNRCDNCQNNYNNLTT